MALLLFLFSNVGFEMELVRSSFILFFYRMVSFYEYVVSRLSASISAIPSQDFHIIVSLRLRLHNAGAKK